MSVSSWRHTGEMMVVLNIGDTGNFPQLVKLWAVIWKYSEYQLVKHVEFRTETMYFGGTSYTWLRKLQDLVLI